MRDRAGAQRGARRQLLFARDAARQQQIGDVHRRHDQHEADAGEQDHQRRPDRADRLIDRAARRWRSSPCWCPGSLLELRGDRLHVGFDLLRRHAGLDAADRAQPVHVADDLALTASACGWWRAIGPENAIGSHMSMPVTRVNPLGPSMPGYGNTKSGGITPITWKACRSASASCRRCRDRRRSAAASSRRSTRRRRSLRRPRTCGRARRSGRAC